MERVAGLIVRSDSGGGGKQVTGEDSFQFGAEIQEIVNFAVPPAEAGSSFTALLGLPANQAIELLHMPEAGASPAAKPPGGEDAWRNHSAEHQDPYGYSQGCSPTFPSNAALIERAARFSIFAAAGAGDSPETSSIPSNSSASSLKPKAEPADTDSNQNQSSPLVTDPTAGEENQKPAKRKEREKKAKAPSKKSKNASNESSKDAEKLPYVHVRARRGQATDSHSLAERVRREKINARMKLLQELVPGCNKITGTALVLDEIISHVQSLQRQVEFLSMRLAAVNPRIDFNLDSLLALESGSYLDNNYTTSVMPYMWPDFHLNGSKHQYQQLWHMDALHHPIWARSEDTHNFVTPENSLLSYDSANSVSLHSNLKMEQL